MDKKLRQLSIIKNRFETCERCFAERLKNPYTARQYLLLWGSN